MSTAWSAVHPTAASIDSILQCIDEAISVSDQYVQKKKERIAYLKSRADQAETLSAKYELTYQLYAEYLPFVNDSAIYYLERCSDIALQMGDESKAEGCLSLTALCCSNAGMYVESEAILKTINPEKLHGIDLGLYYYASGHISGELAYYGKFENMRRQYAETSTTTSYWHRSICPSVINTTINAARCWHKAGKTSVRHSPSTTNGCIM